MCSTPYTPPAAPASLPLPPPATPATERKLSKEPGSNLQSNAGLSHTQVMINGLYSLTRRRKQNRESATDGSFQLITNSTGTCVEKTRHPPCVRAAPQLALAITALRDESVSPFRERGCHDFFFPFFFSSVASRQINKLDTRGFAFHLRLARLHRSPAVLTHTHLQPGSRHRHPTVVGGGNQTLACFDWM